MTTAFGPRARQALTALRQGGGLLDENAAVCRVDGAILDGPGSLAELRALGEAAAAEGFGRLELFGGIQGRIDLETCDVDSLDGEQLSVRLTKPDVGEWCYFLTEDGFAKALEDDIFTAEPRAVWIAASFTGFASAGLTVVPWGGERRPVVPDPLPEQPRKLVRDLTHERTPADLSPWFMVGEVPSPSLAYTAWQRAATRRLAYVLPSEIRRVGLEECVVLKGPRTVTAAVVPMPDGWEDAAFSSLREAVAWVYGMPREAETKFQFLNNHMALDWRDGQFWPDAVARCLASSLAGARAAYAFHLQDQSKDALKALGELRKSLQDEVGRAQTATRDLLSAFWRDFAIAGAVLALRSPTAASITNSEVLRWVTLGVALLLLISLAVNVGANWRFNAISDSSRQDWRRKLYAFVSDEEWYSLVDAPISRGRWVYRVALPAVAGLYLGAAYYLLSVAVPGFTGRYIDMPLAELFS
jgi:hypothetical protein